MPASAGNTFYRLNMNDDCLIYKLDEILCESVFSGELLTLTCTYMLLT